MPGVKFDDNFVKHFWHSCGVGRAQLLFIYFGKHKTYKRQESHLKEVPPSIAKPYICCERILLIFFLLDKCPIDFWIRRSYCKSNSYILLPSCVTVNIQVPATSRNHSKRQLKKGSILNHSINTLQD